MQSYPEMKTLNLFSIFIPTYNRSQSLFLTLKSILSQVKDTDVNIVISDNSRNDETKEMVNSFQGEYKYIRYYKNEENIGIDRNMLKVLDLCDSKYCLMMGDDDIFMEDAFNNIIKFIENKDYDFVALNSINYNKSLLNAEKEITEFSDFNLAFSLLVKKLPYSTIIINLEIAKLIDFTKYINTFHAYSAIAWESFCSINSNRKILVINKLILILGQIEKTWKNDTIEIHFTAIPKWYELLPSVYNPAKNIAYFEYRKSIFSLKYLIKIKRLGYFDKTAFLEYSIILSERINIYLCYYFPIFFSESYLSFKKFVKKNILHR